MPEISEKLWAFLGGAGGGVSLLAAVFGYLKWLGDRADKRAAEKDGRTFEELNESRRRVDAFGDEMYERWQACQVCRDKWRNAYTDLYYKGQGLMPFIGEMPDGAVSVAQQIIDAPPPGKVEE